MAHQAETLALLKALSDETRFRCLEVVRSSPHPISVADVAAEMGLHQNTIRPHLERLREVGLLVVASHQSGTVGRPQNLYSPAEDAPSLGLGTRSYHLLAEMLAGLASRLSDTEQAVEIGREWGSYLGAREAPRPGAPRTDSVDLFRRTFERLGFEPVVEGKKVCFTNCPFRELAEAYPDLNCSLHRGLSEGLTGIREFHPLHSREPCTAVLR